MDKKENKKNKKEEKRGRTDFNFPGMKF